MIALDVAQLVEVVDHQPERAAHALGRDVAQPVQPLDARAAALGSSPRGKKAAPKKAAKGKAAEPADDKPAVKAKAPAARKKPAVKAKAPAKPKKPAGKTAKITAAE